MATLPDWPESLGLPLNSGYKHSLETVTATAMVAGVDRPRRLIDKPTSEFSIGFIWTSGQLDQYRQFAHHQIDGTAGWFVMSLWSGGGLEYHTVRIKTVNKYQLQLPYWSVSFVLECRERFRLSDDVGDALLEWTDEDLINAGNILNESQRNLCQIFKNWDTC